MVELYWSWNAIWMVPEIY